MDEIVRAHTKYKLVNFWEIILDTLLTNYAKSYTFECVAISARTCDQGWALVYISCEGWRIRE